MVWSWNRKAFSFVARAASRVSRRLKRVGNLSHTQRGEHGADEDKIWSLTELNTSWEGAVDGKNGSKNQTNASDGSSRADSTGQCTYTSESVLMT